MTLVKEVGETSRSRTESELLRSSVAECLSGEESASSEMKGALIRMHENFSLRTKF